MSKLLLKKLVKKKTIPCPDYNYVPNHYLAVRDIYVKENTPSMHDFFLNKNFSYTKKGTYVGAIFTCEGHSKGACCDKGEIKKLVGIGY